MSLGLAPLVPLWLVALAALVALLVAGFALWRGMAGWVLRGLALAALAAALAGPQMLRTERQALDDIVILVDDRSASQELGTRTAQTDAALARLEGQLAALPGMQLRRVTLGDDADYWNELYNRLTRNLEELELVRERISLIQEAEHRRITERMNKTMYILGIITGFFLPMSFVAGLLGINVGGIPGSSAPHGFAMACLLMAVIAATQWWIFRRLRWL